MDRPLHVDECVELIVNARSRGVINDQEIAELSNEEMVELITQEFQMVQRRRLQEAMELMNMQEDDDDADENNQIPRGRAVPIQEECPADPEVSSSNVRPQTLTFEKLVLGGNEKVRPQEAYVENLSEAERFELFAKFLPKDASGKFVRPLTQQEAHQLPRHPFRGVCRPTEILCGRPCHPLETPKPSVPQTEGPSDSSDNSNEGPSHSGDETQFSSDSENLTYTESELI